MSLLKSINISPPSDNPPTASAPFLVTALPTVLPPPSPQADELDKKSVLQGRFDRQRTARNLLPGERVAHCLWAVAPTASNVEVYCNRKQRRAFFRNLFCCGSVWLCPVCAARISEARRKELTAAINRKGVHVIHLCFTLQHHIHDDLRNLVDALMGAWGRFKAGASWQRLRDEYYWIGDIRALEPTHGENGWHPHLHVLMLTSRRLNMYEVESFTNAVKRRWIAKLGEFGRDASWEHGVHVRAGNRYAAEYISKFGREPKVNNGAVSGRWTAVHELTKSVVKVARHDGRTPWQLLDDYANGDPEAGRLFQEYAAVFKGRRQLEWSRGLKDLLRIGEASDEELAESPDSDSELLTTISRNEWYRLKQLGREFRAELLEVAAAGDVDALMEWLADRLEESAVRKRSG
jgi:Replication protein.